MNYTNYGVVWKDGIERCTDSWDEVEEKEEQADALRDCLD